MHISPTRYDNIQESAGQFLLFIREGSQFSERSNPPTCMIREMNDLSSGLYKLSRLWKFEVSVTESRTSAFCGCIPGDDGEQN